MKRLFQKLSYDQLLAAAAVLGICAGLFVAYTFQSIAGCLQ